MGKGKNAISRYDCVACGREKKCKIKGDYQNYIDELEALSQKHSEHFESVATCYEYMFGADDT